MYIFLYHMFCVVVYIMVSITLVAAITIRRATLSFLQIRTKFLSHTKVHLFPADSDHSNQQQGQPQQYAMLDLAIVSHLPRTGHCELNALWPIKSCFALLQFIHFGGSPARYSGHWFRRCWPPQWEHMSPSSVHVFRPWPNPRHLVHWITGLWSSTRTLCRSTCARPASVSLCQTGGETCKVTWLSWGFLALLRCLTVTLISSFSSPSRRWEFWCWIALVMSSSVLSDNTFNNTTRGSLFLASSTLSPAEDSLNLFLTASSSVLSWQLTTTFWSFAFLTLSIRILFCFASTAVLILSTKVLLVSWLG